LASRPEAAGASPRPSTRFGPKTSFWDRAGVIPVAGIADSTFLVLVAVGTAALWLGRVGFYSDDWAFLKTFRFAADQSLLGLSRAGFDAWPHARMRPVEVLYLAGLYKLWGLNPLGYQWSNVAVLAAIAVLFWFLLRELGQPRLIALAVPIVYLTLPNYTTARFWMSASENTLSIALYLLSFYADLRSLRAQGRRVWTWRVVGVASLLGCVLAYEVALPLFALNAGVVLLIGRRGARPVLERARRTAALEIAALLGVTVFKVATETRGGINGPYLSHVARFTQNALAVQWRGYGFGLPLRVWQAATRYPDARVLALSFAAAVAILAYLWFVSRRGKSAWPSRLGPAWLGLGALVFALGHAIYLLTDKGGGGGDFTMTGIGNRVAVASTIGVALCFVGAAVWLTRLLPAAARGPVFALSISLVAAGGLLIENTVMNFWAKAYRKEMDVLAAIRERFPRLPSGSALMLDGVCSYEGPATVFESSWDLAGLLNLTYGDPTLRADVVSHRMLVGVNGLHTRIYQDRSFYPFSSDLVVYDPRSDSVAALPDRAAALAYFQRRRIPDCAPGRPGSGAPIF